MDNKKKHSRCAIAQMREILQEADDSLFLGLRSY